MIRDDALPNDIKPLLLSHMEEMIHNARDYDWQQAVQPWSEVVFTLISEGLLTWDSVDKIQMLRMTISRASTACLPASSFKEAPARPRAPAQQPNSEQFKGGTPCFNYNGQQGCSLQSGHLVNGRRAIHVCAF